MSSRFRAVVPAALAALLVSHVATEAPGRAASEPTRRIRYDGAALRSGDVTFRAVIETIRQRGGIKCIETTERVVGETAAVQAAIKYGNGQSEQAQMKLFKENGVWRIAQ